MVGYHRQVAIVPRSAVDSDIWDSQVYLDVNLKGEAFFPALLKARRSFHQLSDGDGGVVVRAEGSKGPPRDRVVDIYLFHGILGSEALVAHKSVKLSRFSPQLSETVEDNETIARSHVQLLLDSFIGT